MVNVNSLFILTGVIGFKSRVNWLTGYNFILGFVHGASGHCIVNVPPPSNAQTKMRLHTDEDYDVFTCFLKNTLAKQQ